jgi:hypothetical protein
MSVIRLSFGVVLSVVLMACSPAPESTESSASTAHPSSSAVALVDGTGVTANLTDLGDGRFRVDYLFAEPQTALIFSRSSGDYRTGSWTALDDGAALERIAGFDALLFDTPRQSAAFTVEVRFVRPEGDYAPYSAFSDGGIVLFTGQFELLPETDRDSIAALEGQLGRWVGEQPVLGVRVQSSRPMIHNGVRRESEATEVSRGSGAFIYIGDAEIFEGRSFAGVVDEGLPAWIRDSFDDDLAAVFAAYETRWGFALSERASVLFAFEGYDHPGFSNKGGASGSSLMLQSSGEGLREESDRVGRYLRWFFAHEAAHLFQTSSGVGLANSTDAWIHEGAATMMANDVLAHMASDPQAERISVYAAAYSACRDFLADGSLQDAANRNQFQAHYDCGAVIALMTDAALPDADIYEFWNALLAMVQEQDAYLAADFYAYVMDQMGADPLVIAALNELVSQDLPDPAASLLNAMELAGLSPEINEAGELIGMDPPR